MVMLHCTMYITFTIKVLKAKLRYTMFTLGTIFFKEHS